tara:strand:- start:74 stop:2254 length:2181 start_codon:yes stop_codon:yes gene_type:complete
MASQEELDRAREIRDIESDRVGISSELLQDLRDSSNAVSDRISQLKFEKQEKGDIRSITRDLNNIAKDNFTLGLKELGTGKNLAKIQKDQVKLQSSIFAASQLRDQFSESTVESEFELAIALEAQVQEAQKLAAELSIIEEESSNIANNFGVKPFSVAEDVVSSIPGLRQFSSSFKEAANSARSVAAAGGTSTKAFAAGAKSIASAAKAALPLLILTEVIDAFIRLDAGAGKIAKQLGISYQESLKLQSSLNGIANVSGNIFVTTQKLTTQFLALNDALGTRAQLESKLLTFQTQLVEQAGLQQKTAEQIGLLQLATGQTAEDITKTFLGAASALNFTEGILLSERQLLEDISGVSDNILASFAANPKALAEATFEAKRLGIDLNRLQTISRSLLDIESSIKNEFTAEVLLGRQLNLVQARELALRKDYAGVGREIRKQGIDLAYFSGLNDIRQQALATSLGMSSDELGKQLLLQEQLSGLGLQDEKAAAAKFELLKQQKGEQFAIQELGGGVLANQLASASASDRFNASVDKLKEVFTGVTMAIMPILDTFVSLVEIVGTLVQAFNPFIQLINVSNNLINDLLIAFGKLIKAAFQFKNFNFTGASETFKSISFQRTADAADAGVASVADQFNIKDDNPTFFSDSIQSNPQQISGQPLSQRSNDRNFGSSSTNLNSFQQEEQFFSGISQAVQKGASQANINVDLDGGRVSKRLSAPLAIDTRRYSY